VFLPTVLDSYQYACFTCEHAQYACYDRPPSLLSSSSLLYLLQEPGSALGIREFKTNLKRIQDGLTRTKETAELRTDIEKEQEKLQLGRKKK
jgi:hypothetical protein